MNRSREFLRRLGAGESIASVCQAANWSREEFDAWWKTETAMRAPRYDGERTMQLQAELSIRRDRWGIPHIQASSNDDLWVGFGYAIAQDRLFQLDYLRRKGLGRLAEILGQDGIASDLVARTVGLNRVAEAEWDVLPQETRILLEAFSRGVNAWLDECSDRLPIEFDLLDYRPHPWSPIDCLAIENEFRWYLTGRFPVIVMPELAKRVLGNGELYEEFLLGEEDEEAIVPPEAYRNLSKELSSSLADLTNLPRETVGQTTGDPEGTGSNNWVVSGRLSESKLPMLASDPHIAFEAVSCWYEVHLVGGEFNVAGMAYAGVPAILCGRNERTAWGITNNICSQRDLYQERTDPAHPDCFLFDGSWEKARELKESISVKNAAPITRTIRFSRNGPIVDEILPAPGPQTGPVSLKWLGASGGGWLTAMLQMNRAKSVSEFRESLRPWHVPTFNLVVADVDGNIAVQSAGRIPLRKIAERGYRPGWDPQHQWLGLVPYDAMPHCVNPARGWLITANNRVAANDYPYPLFGTWVGGHRARRIREMIQEITGGPDASPNSQPPIKVPDFIRMQHDTLSLRARTCVPALVEVLNGDSNPLVMDAVRVLRDWNGFVEANSIAATLFNVFFTNWTRVVTDVRFEGATAELVSRQAEGIASRLLLSDPIGWFAGDERVRAIRTTFDRTLRELQQRFGPDMSQWQWVRVHQMPLKHVLSGRGELAHLLDQGGGPVKGEGITVCNTGIGPGYQANLGAGYRMIVDLATDSLLAVDAQSQSGHPGTEHYSDQFANWHSGDYHAIPLDPASVEKSTHTKFIMRPSS